VYNIAVLGQITWVDLGGLVFAVTSLLVVIIGALVGFITRILVHKIDTVGANVIMINDRTIKSQSDIGHLKEQHDECRSDRDGLHKRITDSQGGV
jgi:hypothetical protein